jgi:hypothetical protein
VTFSFLWFAVGIAVGVNVTLAGLWWSLRRENRKAAPIFFTGAGHTNMDPGADEDRIDITTRPWS